MKYDAQIAELKNILPTAKNVLIALPAGADIDRLSAGLALFLSLKRQGKEASIVCQDAMRVSQAHLFGIDHVQENISPTEGGNLTLTLEGVAASDGTVPALQKLDWYAENNNLNLVFHVLPGQTFNPRSIVPRYQGGGYDLIFVIGAVSLNSLGNIYNANSAVFSGTHIVNVDNQVGNAGFGQTNVVDTNAATVSETLVFLLTDLGLPLDADPASNLIAGIFTATNNLTSPKVSADTFMAVAQCLRVGGKKPQEISTAGPTIDLSAFMPQSAATPSPIGRSQPEMVSTSAASPAEPQPSPEERPAGEGVSSAETIEPDWLTPKIFKGGSLG